MHSVEFTYSNWLSRLDSFRQLVECIKDWIVTLSNGSLHLVRTGILAIVDTVQQVDHHVIVSKRKSDSLHRVNGKKEKFI